MARLPGQTARKLIHTPVPRYDLSPPVHPGPVKEDSPMKTKRFVSTLLALLLICSLPLSAFAEEYDLAQGSVTKTAKCDHCDATDTIPDPGSRLVWLEDAPLYRVIDQDVKALSCKAERQDGVLTITVDADFASLTGKLGGIQTLKAQGVDTIVFVTNGASSTFALADLLSQGSTGDTYTLTHDGAAVTFTLGTGKTDISAILTH